MESLPHDAAQFTPLRPNRRGSILIEAVVVAGVLLVGSLGFATLFTATSEVDRSNRESVFAARAVQSALERLEGFEPHEEVVACHNETIDDDLVGLTPLSGFTLDGFEVAGLAPAQGDADGLVGQVVFPVNPFTGLPNPGVAVEDLQTAQELILRVNGSGSIGSGIELVPVIVRVQWDSAGRTRTHQVLSLLAPR